MKTKDKVVKELRRRARAGNPLNSGYNRGDWLYAAAVKHHGSWGAAVQAAGYDYDEIKIRPLTAAEVKAEIQKLAASGKKVLAAGQGRLAEGARRHFGSWKSALQAAGLPDTHFKWTPERVIDIIRRRQNRGQPVNPMAILRADPNLYAAGRRRFGSWDAALDAALDGEPPVVRIGKVGRPRKTHSKQ